MPLNPLMGINAANPYYGQLKALIDQLEQSQKDHTTALSDLHLESANAQAAQDTALRELSAAQQAPFEQVPISDQVVSRSIANLAAVLMQSDAPRQQAEQSLQEKQGMLLKRREDNIGRLETAYKSAADRAEKIGNIELQIKFGEKLAKLDKDRQNLYDTMRAAAGEEGDTKRAQAQRQTQLDIAQYGIIEAAIRAGQGSYNPSTKKYTAFAGKGGAKRTDTKPGDFLRFTTEVKNSALKAFNDKDASSQDKLASINNIGQQLDETVNAAGVLASENTPQQTLTRLLGIQKPSASETKGGMFGFGGGDVQLSNAPMFDTKNAIMKTIELWGLDRAADDPEIKADLLNFLSIVGRNKKLGLGPGDARAILAELGVN